MIISLLHSAVRRRLLRHGALSKHLRLGSQDIHYYELLPKRQDGVLVLVHGLGTSSSTWINILPEIRNMRILAPDLPGFGFSPAPEKIPTLHQYEDWLARFLDATAPGPFTLVGHSMGGWITVMYALRHENRANHLVLINTAGMYYDGVDSLRDAFVLHSTRDTRVLLDRIWVRYPWYFRPFTPFVFRDLVRRRVPEIVGNVRREDFVDTGLGNLSIPVSVIWGLGDKLIAPDALRILEEKLSPHRIHTIKNSGHVPQLQAPAELLTILRSILPE